MRPISSISISVQQFAPRPVNEFDFQKTKKKTKKRQCALLLAWKIFGQCQRFIHFGNMDHLLLRITLIKRKSFFVSFSIRSLSLMPFRKWLVVFQRRRSLIHFICPFLSLFCSFFILTISRACNTPLQSCYLNTEQCGHCPHFIGTHNLRFIGSENSQDGKGLWLGNSPLHTNRPNTIFEVKY